MPGLNLLLVVMLGGAIGSLLRFIVSYGFTINNQPAYLATLAVNLVGSFAIGCCYAWFSSRTGISEATRVLLMTGLLGGLTTFSSFTLESLRLLENAQWSGALFYILGSLLGGLVAAWLGVFLIRTIG